MREQSTGWTEAARKTVSAPERSVLEEAENSLRRGAKPDREEAIALVQHFAPPVEAPAQGVRLETEVIALSVEPEVLFLRVSIDSARNERPAKVQLSIDRAFSSDAIPALGEAKAAVDFSTLPSASNTRVYTLPRSAGSRPGASLASVRVRYRHKNGEEREVERTIGSEDVRGWNAASQRGQAASLVAALMMRVEEGRPVNPLTTLARERQFNELAALIESVEGR